MDADREIIIQPCKPPIPIAYNLIRYNLPSSLRRCIGSATVSLVQPPSSCKSDNQILYTLSDTLELLSSLFYLQACMVVSFPASLCQTSSLATTPTSTLTIIVLQVGGFNQPENIMRSVIVVAVLLCLSLVGGSRAQPQTFGSLFNPWTKNINVSPTGLETKIWLDPLFASGFNSKQNYLFGSYSMMMKLVPGDSAGTVATFYMSSSGATHDEFDFEFLGNVSGQPYVLHTNIFSNGVGNREIQYNLWFDATAAFHKYEFQWNQDIVVFYVDDIAIRIFKRNEKIVPYPNKQAMGVFASIWDGSDWATQGGAIKINWAHAPFVATYSNYNLKGCVVGTAAEMAACKKSKYARPGTALQTFTGKRVHQINWVKKYVKYNYCKDLARFNGKQPPECKMNLLY